MTIDLQRLIRPVTLHRHHKDVQRIMEAARIAGYEISYTDAVWAWEEYSEQFYAAGWLGVGDDAEILRVLKLMLQTESEL